MTSPAGRVWAQLGPDDRSWLTAVATLAGPGADVALVGGAVRDALLGGRPLDLDVAVYGADVEALARATGLPMTFHPAFQNATVTLPDGRAADLVRARRESYPVPGRNPVPAPGTLEDDLRRRDFSVNALALRLSPTGPAALLDVVGGVDDLHARTLRPLHAQSLREDASRLVRGARLAARLGLSAHPDLLAQVPDALEMADRTPRLWAELKLLLAEPRPGAAARILRTWGAGTLLPDTSVLDALDDQREHSHTVTPQTYAAALLHAAPDPDALAARLDLGDRPAALLARAVSDTHFPEGTPERQLRALLRPDAYTPLTGRDVVSLGVAPGPAVGAALAHLAALRRAGTLRSADDERRALHSYLTGK
ncbi:tRNA nucleotidyltransferase (CCA-adding enzyme) [Deinococcus metalli]|uniref:tRNA nucleotidyltransferase n=1 Tax=Deinococcus metalli TaxID=1141878 RepID=A0A7W8NP29_9DEIO|nr:CCA tRNA nucleotidyltransferase [Deinococcus metalli]MBB5377554.1 tRNA nucleotidyltransferase (CCA-adding enzyme) [Deinococcus metalli]GHF51329.1 tRNA nucleotidyltransferase [Deinococcus metalli]